MAIKPSLWRPRRTTTNLHNILTPELGRAENFDEARPFMYSESDHLTHHTDHAETGS